MFLLDTDTTGLAIAGHEGVTARILSTPNYFIFVSSVSLEEVLQGALAAVKKRRALLLTGIQAPALALIRTIQELARFQLLAYGDDADRLFRSFPASVKRVGGMDCRIAAHAMVSGFVVVTRNTQDFERIPGVKIEDWSV